MYHQSAKEPYPTEYQWSEQLLYNTSVKSLGKGKRTSKRHRNTTATEQGPRFQRMYHQLYNLRWSPEYYFEP